MRTCRVCSLLQFDGKKWCFSRLPDSFSPLPFPFPFSPLPFPRPVVLSTGSNALLPYTMTGPLHAASNNGRDLHFRLHHYRDAALLYHCSEDLPLNCCNCCRAAGRAHRLEWVRRQLDPPATFSSNLSQNVQLSTNDGAFARTLRVSSAMCTTGERSLQSPNPTSSPAPTTLTFGSKKNRRRH